MIVDHGYEEGAACGRDGCTGTLEEHPVENCSCHISPPCNACTTPREFYPECDWEAKDDTVDVEGDITIYMTDSPFMHVERSKRVLDTTKIDYVITMHSNSSQKCTGCYPSGTSQDDVLKRVEGTFGGRFEKFSDGKFVYIAYTD